jgi:hypothetical protein
MNPVQFCLQPDNKFVVRNLGNRKNDPSDDANIVQMCSPINTLGLYTIELHTAATSNSPYCTTIRLQLAPTPPIVPIGCPPSTIPIPTDQLFRVKSSNFGTWLLGPGLDDQPPAAALTSDREAATLFTVSESSSDRIVYGVTVTQRFGAYYTGQYGQNSGRIDFGPDGQQTPPPPVLFCLQPDNTFALYSEGNDGPETIEDQQNSEAGSFGADPTVAVSCPEVKDSPAYGVFIDNGAYMAVNPDGPCAPDVLVYEPVEPSTGCIPIPAGDFRIRSFAQKTLSGEVWLLANIDVQGTVVTTSDINEATRFSPTNDGTGRIQTSQDGNFFYSAFAPYFNEDSGYIRMYPDGVATPAVTFCLQSDNSLAVYSAGEDGPTPADPRSVLTCPNRAQPVYLDNGSYAASPGEPTCVRDTLYYEALP